MRRIVQYFARSTGLLSGITCKESVLLIRKPADIRPSEITSKENYLNRRQFMAAGAAAGSIALASPVLGAVVPRGEFALAHHG